MTGSPRLCLHIHALTHQIPLRPRTPPTPTQPQQHLGRPVARPLLRLEVRGAARPGRLPPPLGADDHPVGGRHGPRVAPPLPRPPPRRCVRVVGMQWVFLQRAGRQAHDAFVSACASINQPSSTNDGTTTTTTANQHQASSTAPRTRAPSTPAPPTGPRRTSTRTRYQRNQERKREKGGWW